MSMNKQGDFFSLFQQNLSVCLLAFKSIYVDILCI